MENPNLKQPKHSVVILVYHRSPQLVEMAQRCVDSVKKNSPEGTEIIIVDNGSTERHNWEDYCDTYIRFDRNMGISRGWNMGIVVSRGKYITVLGDDTEVPEEWLDGMAKCFDNPDCGVANPHVEHLPVGVGIKHDYKWFSGACFMVTKDVLLKTGLFRDDLYFPTDSEDRDFWMRIYKAGYKCYKNFDVHVKHAEGQTTKADDLHAEKPKTKQAFVDEWGFDSDEVFCGDRDIYEVLKTQS